MSCLAYTPRPLQYPTNANGGLGTTASTVTHSPLANAAGRCSKVSARSVRHRLEDGITRLLRVSHMLEIWMRCSETCNFSKRSEHNGADGVVFGVAEEGIRKITDGYMLVLGNGRLW